MKFAGKKTGEEDEKHISNSYAGCKQVRGEAALHVIQRVLKPLNNMNVNIACSSELPCERCLHPSWQIYQPFSRRQCVPLP